MKLLSIILTVLALASTSVAKNTKSDKKEIVLSEDNTLILSEAFSGSSVVKLMEQATKMDSNLKSGYPIYLFLYTPGGSIQAGLELFEFLDGLNRPVHTVTLFAASMGFQTVQHLGTRYVLKYGVLMSHKARGGFEGEFGGGISQLDSRLGLWLRRVNIMDQKTVDRTKGKQTIKSYTDAYNPELWLNGDEAVEKGYADQVVTVKCDSTLSGTYDIVEDFVLFKVKVKLSKCPIKTYPLALSIELATNKGFMTVEEFIQKNGKFGDACFAKKEQKPTEITNVDPYARSGYYSSYNSLGAFGSGLVDDTALAKKEEPKKEELCVQDPTITIESINKAKEERRKYYTRNLKDHIVYSY